MIESPNAVPDENETPAKPLRGFDSVWKRALLSAIIGQILGLIAFASAGVDWSEAALLGLIPGVAFGILYGITTWAFRPYKQR